MERVYLTQEGYERLATELEELKNKKRREISAAIEHARSLGDLKENAEYHAAKEAMAANEKKIGELEERLSRVEIIDRSGVDNGTAYIGAKLKLTDLDTGGQIEYLLVGPDEADAANGRISVDSPVGKSLLGHKKGDTIEIDVPAGKLKYRITGVSR